MQKNLAQTSDREQKFILAMKAVDFKLITCIDGNVERISVGLAYMGV